MTFVRSERLQVHSVYGPWDGAGRFATTVDAAAEYIGSTDETCELYLAHWNSATVRTLLALRRVHTTARERERDLAGPTRPLVFPLRGLGAEAWTLVLAAREDQVPSSSLLYPHLHQADHGLVSPTGQAQEHTCTKRRVVDDCWALGEGDAGPPGVAPTHVAALAAFNPHRRKPVSTQKQQKWLRVSAHYDICPSGLVKQTTEKVRLMKLLWAS